MRIGFFASSLVSAYWNGAATYYRGIARALHNRGHTVIFFEPDAYERQTHRDIADPPWAQVVVYAPTADAARRAIGQAQEADVVVKASGVGVLDELLEADILELKKPSRLIVFWDVDAPATLERVGRDGADPFAALIPRYDAIFTYGGGAPVVEAYTSLGARACAPIYNALDPETHYPVSADERFSGDLGFIGNRLPDRERRVEDFFLQPARALPRLDFVLGGAGWEDKPRSANVRYCGHVYTRFHNAFNSTTGAVLNISRESMARNGYSPATRVFEAAGAAACIITDAWEGIEMFLEPEGEVLVARDGQEVVERLRALTPRRRRMLGQAARERVLAQHTYRRRAELVESILEGKRSFGLSCVSQ